MNLDSNFSVVDSETKTTGFIFLTMLFYYLNEILDKLKIQPELFYALVIIIITANIAKFSFYISFKKNIFEFFKADLPARFLVFLIPFNIAYLSIVIPSLKYILDYCLILIIIGEFLETIAVIHSLKTRKDFNFQTINFYAILISKIKEKILKKFPVENYNESFIKEAQKSVKPRKPRAKKTASSSAANSNASQTRRKRAVKTTAKPAESAKQPQKNTKGE